MVSAKRYGFFGETSRMSSKASTPGIEASSAFARRKSASSGEPSACLRVKTTPCRIRPGVRVGIGRQSISRSGSVDGTSGDHGVEQAVGEVVGLGGLVDRAA